MQVAGAVVGQYELGCLAGRVAHTVQRQLREARAAAANGAASADGGVAASALATAYLHAAARQLQVGSGAPGRAAVPLEAKTADNVRDVVQVRFSSFAVCTIDSFGAVYTVSAYIILKVERAASSSLLRLTTLRFLLLPPPTPRLFVKSQCVGVCVTMIAPRSSIAATGILPVLHSLVARDDESLAPVHCEFLQSCIYAEQYRYAESRILYAWPRPQSSHARVETVLRYYYLRGVVHMGCDHAALAVRCFWTCLSVPAAADANVVSAIAVAAWKKLVLLQSLRAESILTTRPAETVALVKGVASSVGPLSTPKEMSAGMTRFLSTAKPPPPDQSLESERATSPISSPLLRGAPPPEEEPDVMHLVEQESDLMGAANVEDTDVRYPSQGLYVYRELVHAYSAIDRVAFDAIVQEHSGLFREDGNFGMVRRVGAALVHRQVYEMSSIYAVISLDQLAAELGLTVPDARALLEQLQTEKAWPVEVKDGTVVVFPPSPPIPNSDAALTTSELAQLTRMVQLLDVAIASSFKYSAAVQSAMKSDKSGGPRGVEDV